MLKMLIMDSLLFFNQVEIKLLYIYTAMLNTKNATPLLTDNTNTIQIFRVSVHTKKYIYIYI